MTNNHSIKYISLIIGLLLIFTDNLKAQESGNLMIVSSEGAMLYIDGIEYDPLEKDKPFKVSLEVGQHFVQLISTMNYTEKSDSVEIRVNAIKVLKFNFQTDIQGNMTQSKTVADMDLVIPGLLSLDSDGNYIPMEMYFAFEDGDIITVNVEMRNNNGTNALSVKSYPEGIIKYQNKAFNDLNNQKITIDKKGIYKFEFATQHTFDRNIHLKIMRKPISAETENFNTNVIEKRVFEPVSIVQSEQFTINSGINATLQGGKSRILIPLQFPENTVKWYYEYSAMRNAEDLQRVKENFNLLGGISNLLGPQAQLLNFALEGLSQPPGTDICDIYLLDDQNSSLFTNKYQFNYLLAGTRENFKSGIVEINCCFDKPYFLGVKNPDETHGIEVLIEVVAIVEKKEYIIQN